ncbi:MAG: Zn-ribbon domain-containing OB-fold protein [Candidatus Nezhaarchaeales archaeon]
MSNMSVPKAPRIWQLAERRYRLVGSKCLKCGRLFVGLRKVCPQCKSTEFEYVELSRRGKIYSYTVIRAPPMEREKYGPYIMAIVELDDGCRLTAEIVDCSSEEIDIGTEVEATFRKIGEESESGIIYYACKFRPVVKGV